MKTIKKLKLEYENSFKIIENGLSKNQLSHMELSTLMGGYSGYDDFCGGHGCPIHD